ncbi:hypothetical protein L3N51_01452 [Metallosphaera sp. J1]|nr:hypothetical protein [Metallosphaera javensis (ex Hofmann et al. 2022)]
MNLMDVTGLSREDVQTWVEKLREWLWPEPSHMNYVQVVYAGKVVTGLTGKLRYSIAGGDMDMIRRVISTAISLGIGTSRRNGFGRIRVRVR